MGASESAASSIDNFERSQQNGDNLQFVQQINNVRYGEAKVVQNIETNKKYAIKTFVLSNKSEFKELFQQATSKQQQMQIPSIVNIVDIKTEINEHFCSNFYKVIIVYEYFDNTLEKLINMNKNQQTPFNEQDIYFLIDCILSALMCMHYCNFTHCDIRPKTILVSPDGSYKITDMNFLYNQQPTPYKQTVLGAATYHKMYLSPEKLHAIKNRDLQKIQEYIDDWQRGDVFSLGLVALEMATLRDINSEVIDYETLEIKKNVLDELLEIVKSRYSYNLYCLIQQMLELDHSKRNDFYKLAEFLTPQSQQDSILSLQSNQLHNNQIKEFMLSDSNQKAKIYLDQHKKEGSGKKVTQFDETSIRQSTIAMETNETTRADINKMMTNNQKSEVFNRYKIKLPQNISKKSNSENQIQNQQNFQAFSQQEFVTHSKSPRLLHENSNNANRNYQPESFKNRQQAARKETSPFKNIENKENMISYKIERQNNLLTQLQKLDVKVNDILEQSQTIKNQFKSKKIEESIKQEDFEEQDIYNVIEQKKQTIRNLKLEKDNILSNQNSQKNLFQNQEHPSQLSLNHYAPYSNKYIASPSSQNSSMLRCAESNRSKRDEASPYSTKYLNQKSKSPVSCHNYYQPNQYFESKNQKRQSYRAFQDFTQKNPYSHLNKGSSNKLMDTSPIRMNDRKLTDQSQMNNNKKKYDLNAEKSYNFQKAYDYKSRNHSPILYKPHSNLNSQNTSYIQKGSNQDISTLSNQNKSNITLYELYLRDYENMIQKTQEQENTQN
ncbi:hypothetical protein ABPG74_006578 [Tetrahymena malaccensis]